MPQLIKFIVGCSPPTASGSTFHAGVATPSQVAMLLGVFHVVGQPTMLLSITARIVHESPRRPAPLSHLGYHSATGALPSIRTVSGFAAALKSASSQPQLSGIVTIAASSATSAGKVARDTGAVELDFGIRVVALYFHRSCECECPRPSPAHEENVSLANLLAPEFAVSLSERARLRIHRGPCCFQWVARPSDLGSLLGSRGIRLHTL